MFSLCSIAHFTLEREAAPSFVCFSTCLTAFGKLSLSRLPLEKAGAPPGLADELHVGRRRPPSLGQMLHDARMPCSGRASPVRGRRERHPYHLLFQEGGSQPREVSDCLVGSTSSSSHSLPDSPPESHLVVRANGLQCQPSDVGEQGFRLLVPSRGGRKLTPRPKST